MAVSPATGYLGVGTSNPAAALHVKGGIVAETAYHTHMYGVPVMYDTAGTDVDVGTLSNQYHYLGFPSSTAAVTASNSSRYYPPVSGLYMLKFAYDLGLSAGNAEPFISKNLANGSDLDAGDDRLIAIGSARADGERRGTMTGAAELTPNDYVSVGFLSTGAIIPSLSTRSSFSMTCVQRTE